jgi:alpha-glucosidase
MARDPHLLDNPEYDLADDEHLASWTEANAPRDQDWPEVHEILRGFRRTLEEYDARIAIGEVFILDPRRLIGYYGRGDDELHLAFNFAFLRAPWSADAFRDEVETFERLLPRIAWPDYTLSNHDNPRTASRYAPGGDIDRGRLRARAGALMLLTLRGTPFLYYGEEIGMADGVIPADRVVDVAGRDPERTPMQWDASQAAGFTTGEPWLPVAADAPAVNVEAQTGDPASMLSLYRELIRIRRASPALRRGDYATLPEAPPHVFAYTRSAARERWLVALNFGSAPARVVVPGAADPSSSRGVLRLSTDATRAVGGPIGAELEVGSDEGVLVELSPAGEGS